MKYSGSCDAGYGAVPRTANGITARRFGSSRGSPQLPRAPVTMRNTPAPDTAKIAAAAHGRHARRCAASSCASHAPGTGAR